MPKMLSATSTVGAAVADGFTELETLAGELREWYDTQSWRDDVEEAASSLEGLTEPDTAPEAIRELVISFTRATARNPSRRARRDQVTMEIDMAINAAQEWADDNAGSDHADLTAVNEWIEAATTLKDDADAVDFPGRNQ